MFPAEESSCYCLAFQSKGKFCSLFGSKLHFYTRFSLFVKIQHLRIRTTNENLHKYFADVDYIF
jgi:hypothetical protein